MVRSRNGEKGKVRNELVLAKVNPRVNKLSLREMTKLFQTRILDNEKILILCSAICRAYITSQISGFKAECLNDGKI